jgi:hypothetical protein
MAMLVGPLGPLVVDLAPGVPRAQGGNTDDFDPELGSVDIDNDISNHIIERILKLYRYIFLDGIAVLQTFLNVIAEQGDWLVVILTEADMNRIDPKYDSTRDSHGGHHVIHFFLLKNKNSGVIKYVASTRQMASAIGSVSTPTFHQCIVSFIIDSLTYPILFSSPRICFVMECSFSDH